jgi:hypothetical protein
MSKDKIEEKLDEIVDAITSLSRNVILASVIVYTAIMFNSCPK